MLPNGLRLFFADIVDDETDKQTFWYIVGKTSDSAFKRFVKEANATWYKYDYHFYEIEDEKEIRNFIDNHGNIKAGIYE